MHHRPYRACPGSSVGRAARENARRQFDSVPGTTFAAPFPCWLRCRSSPAPRGVPKYALVARLLSACQPKMSSQNHESRSSQLCSLNQKIDAASDSSGSLAFWGTMELKHYAPILDCLRLSQVRLPHFPHSVAECGDVPSLQLSGKGALAFHILAGQTSPRPQTSCQAHCLMLNTHDRKAAPASAAFGPGFSRFLRQQWGATPGCLIDRLKSGRPVALSADGNTGPRKSQTGFIPGRNGSATFPRGRQSPLDHYHEARGERLLPLPSVVLGHLWGIVPLSRHQELGSEGSKKTHKQSLDRLTQG